MKYELFGKPVTFIVTRYNVEYELCQLLPSVIRVTNNPNICAIRKEIPDFPAFTLSHDGLTFSKIEGHLLYTIRPVLTCD